MKFAFCTCVQIGLSCMEAIYEADGKLDLIISLPDDKAVNKSGRIYVDDFADKHNIPVVKSGHINDEQVIQALKKHDIDWLYIIGWSQIASKEVLNAANKGAIGAHPTLLPQGRGRAAIPWSIIKGLDKTGVTFFKMDEGVDTGLVLGQEVIPIKKEETASTLYEKVNKAHEDLIRDLHPKLERDSVKGEIQDEAKATYWEGRKPEDGELHQSMTLQEVDRLVRATTKPYPGAFIMDGVKKIIIWAGTPDKHDDASMELEFNDGIYSVLKYELIDA
jgi:methionyl-tRNA formyltransferase